MKHLFDAKRFRLMLGSFDHPLKPAEPATESVVTFERFQLLVLQLSPWVQILVLLL